MRHTLVGYVIAIVVGAVVGTGSAVVAPYMFDGPDRKVVAQQIVAGSQWQDGLELALEDPVQDQKHASAVTVNKDLLLGLELAGASATR